LIEDRRSQSYLVYQYTMQRACIRYLEINYFERRHGSRQSCCMNKNDDRFILLNSLRNRFWTVKTLQRRIMVCAGISTNHVALFF